MSKIYFRTFLKMDKKGYTHSEKIYRKLPVEDLKAMFQKILTEGKNGLTLDIDQYALTEVLLDKNINYRFILDDAQIEFLTEPPPKLILDETRKYTIMRFPSPNEKLKTKTIIVNVLLLYLDESIDILINLWYNPMFTDHPIYKMMMEGDYDLTKTFQENYDQK